MRLYQDLGNSEAGEKFILVDACRTLGRAKARTRTNAVKKVPVPRSGVAAFLSCAPGQSSFEHRDLKHGVFFHYVVEGLKRTDLRNIKRELTWGNLTEGVH